MVDDQLTPKPREGVTDTALPDSQGWPAFPTGIQLRLVAAEPPAGLSHKDLVEPFVTLGNRGRFSRTLLAHVVGPGSGTIREVALKMQSDEYPVAELSGWTNLDIDEQWREQYRLWRAAAAGDATAAIVDVLPEAADGGAPLLPPTLYCKQRRAFFVAPCPKCGAPLETCQDNVLLDEHGLPRYDRSLERFLYCRICRETGCALRFYALILTDLTLRNRAPVGEQIDLYRALGRLARKHGPLPCAGCASVPSCYPDNDALSGDVTRVLTPVSFYEYRCLPLERLHVHYDDFAALLGGRAPDTVDAAVPSLRSGSRPKRRYLFEGDPRGKLPLELLRLKLILFGQLVSAVSSLHRTTRLPHLALSPENVMVEVRPGPNGLPAFYNFRTRLLGIGSCRQRPFNGLDTARLAIPILDPPPVRDATYAPPLLTASQPPNSGLLTIAALTRAGGERMILEGDLASDAFDVRTLRPKDAVQVVVRQGRPLAIALEVLANPIRQGSGSVSLRSTPLALEDTLTTQLQSLIGQGPIRATFIVHQCLHVPCDLQSLGLLLFTTLLVNTAQGPTTVAAAAREVSARIVHFARERPTASAEEIGEFALHALRESEAGGSLSPRHLFDNPSERGDWNMSSLGSFWYAAFVLGLRALTQVSGFGFCREHDDFDPAHPEGPVDHLKAELDILGHGIEAELLAMRGKRLEVTEAIERVRAQFQGAALERTRAGTN